MKTKDLMKDKPQWKTFRELKKKKLFKATELLHEHHEAAVGCGKESSGQEYIYTCIVESY